MLRVLLGLFFILSGLAKFWSLSSFADVLRGYSFLSESFIGGLTYSIPGAEVVLGGLFLGGYRIANVSFLLLLMVFGFTLAAFLQYQNGVVANCGCFGSLIERKNDWRLFVENTILISLLGFVFYKQNGYTN